MPVRLFRWAAIVSLSLGLPIAPVAYSHPGHQESIAYFSEKIASQPTQQNWYLMRGMRYMEDGDFGLAEQDFEAAMQRGNPETVYLPLGVLNYRRGDFQRSITLLDAVLASQPDNWQALHYRSLASLALGNLESAIDDARRYLRLKPEPDAADFIALAQIYLQKGADGVTPSLQVLDDANQRLGLTPQVQDYAIRVELNRNRPDLALERQLRLQEFVGATPKSNLETARLLQLLDRKAEAKQYLIKTVAAVKQLRPTPARKKLLETAQTALQQLRES